MFINSQYKKNISSIFFLLITISLTSITLYFFNIKSEEDVYDEPDYYELDYDEPDYYDPDYYIQFLRTLSLPLTENITEDLDKAVALMTFTTYYMAFKSVNLSKRIDVFSLVENREGLCSEFATLFVSLSISIGINGRRTGLLLGDLGHQLTEIYINGKWQVFDPLYNIYFNETTQEIIHNYNITERRMLFNTTYDNVQHKEGWAKIAYTNLADYFVSFYLIIENPGIFKPLYPERSQIYNDGQNPTIPIFTDIDWYD